jgi:protein-S-isoprenylcysteine O-methyltransferase Ste14
MSDQIAAIAKQRGKVVVLLVVLGFVQGMVHPETAGSVWPAIGIAVGALAAMEAWSSRSDK